MTAFVGCYNHSRFVEECLDSVRHQTYPNLEVIIFDDWSKDNSISVINTWLKKHRLDWQFIPHTRNIGICASLNEVLRLARGKYISVVAADDVWLPDKTTRQVAMMEQMPKDIGVLYSDAFQINESGEALPQMFIEAHRKLVTPPEGFLFDLLWEGNFIPAMATLIRRECFTLVGTYDEDLCFEDWDMGAGLLPAKINLVEFDDVDRFRHRNMKREGYYSRHYVNWMRHLFYRDALKLRLQGSHAAAS